MNEQIGGFTIAELDLSEREISRNVCKYFSISTVPSKCQFISPLPNLYTCCQELPQLICIGTTYHTTQVHQIISHELRSNGKNSLTNGQVHVMFGYLSSQWMIIISGGCQVGSSHFTVPKPKMTQKKEKGCRSP